jgi:hypothetical protein
MDKRHFVRKNPEDAFKWPEEAVDLLKEGIAQGWSSGVIRNKLQLRYKIDLTRSAVMGKIHRLKLRDGKGAQPKVHLGNGHGMPVEWSPELDLVLREHKLRLPAAKVAQVMKLPLKSVRARIHFLGIETVTGAAGKTGAKTINVRRAREAARAAAMAPRAPTAPNLPEAVLATPERPGVGFFELKPHHCRWPLWAHQKPTVDRQFYCGDEKDERSSSWCPHHLAIAMPYPPGGRPRGMHA